jgi:hypothetical protein
MGGGQDSLKIMNVNSFIQLCLTPTHFCKKSKNAANDIKLVSTPTQFSRKAYAAICQ